MPEEEESIQLPPASLSGLSMPTIRPGIVHRLDKGTTGLLISISFRNQRRCSFLLMPKIPALKLSFAKTRAPRICPTRVRGMESLFLSFFDAKVTTTALVQV